MRATLISVQADSTYLPARRQLESLSVHRMLHVPTRLPVLQALPQASHVDEVSEAAGCASLCASAQALSWTSLTCGVPSTCRWINEQRITIYVEHPVPIAPPVEEAAAAPMPLVLTARERKKMRTQRRMEREKERQVGLQAACDAETHRRTDKPVGRRS